MSLYTQSSQPVSWLALYTHQPSQPITWLILTKLNTTTTNNNIKTKTIKANETEWLRTLLMSFGQEMHLPLPQPPCLNIYVLGWNVQGRNVLLPWMCTTTGVSLHREGKSHDRPLLGRFWRHFCLHCVPARLSRTTQFLHYLKTNYYGIDSFLKRGATSA